MRQNSLYPIVKRTWYRLLEGDYTRSQYYTVKEFWELLALYISSNTLSSVPWAIPFGDEQIQVMVNQAKDVLSWYDDMKNSVPTWYKGVIGK